MKKAIKKEKYKGCEFCIYEEDEGAFSAKWVDSNGLEHSVGLQTEAAKVEEIVKDQIDVEGSEAHKLSRARMNMPFLRNKKLSFDMDKDKYPARKDSRSMQEVSEDIRKAGQEGSASKPEPVVPEPKMKTPEEMKNQVPNAILNPAEDKQVDGKVVETMGADPKLDPSKVEMPGTHTDEAAWKEAKAAAKKQYPGVSEDNDRFWKITESIYKSMTGE